MPHTFNVDNVEPVLTPLPRRTVRERFPEVIDGASAESSFVDSGEAHPLIAAVHFAFSQHRPLVLTPDAVWITIAQGFAQHLRLNSEKFRSRFVRHSGRKVLIVRHPSPELPEQMEPIIEEFQRKLAEELGPGMARLMTCDFSTTTSVERTASAVVMMDAFQPFYEYAVYCVCGIPRITVTGTEQDWRAIGERVRILGEYELEWWTPHVEKIVRHLQQSAAGKPDAAFFRRIYKPEDAYGGEVVTGWIARLYPYVKGDGAFRERNPLLTVAEEEIGRSRKASNSMFDYSGPCISADSTMPGLSKVEMVVEISERPTRNFDLLGGLVGVRQHDDGALEAQAGWFVVEAQARISDVIEKLRGAGLPELPSQSSQTSQHGESPFKRSMTRPEEIMALYSSFDGGMLPFGWLLRPARELAWGWHVIKPHFKYASVEMTVFADLPDRSMLAFAQAGCLGGPRRGVVHLPPGSIFDENRRDENERSARWDWSLLCEERDIAWVGNTIAEVLLRAFETGGADVRARKAGQLPTLLDFADHDRKQE
jgi:hypothetical protein